jgi:hypothetical protein
MTRIFGTQTYGNYRILPQRDEWKSRSDNPADKFIDSLDSTAARHLAERAIASVDEIAAAEQAVKDQKTFCVMYPSYVDNDYNVRLMQYHWENVLGVKQYPTLEQLEDCFFTLRDKGVLQLNEKQLAKEDQEATLRRAAEIREKREADAFNEDAAELLSKEELKRRAMGWSK